MFDRLARCILERIDACSDGLGVTAPAQYLRLIDAHDDAISMSKVILPKVGQSGSETRIDYCGAGQDG